MTDTLSSGGVDPEQIARGLDIEAMKLASTRRIIGPTIMLGSGTYFDYEDPEHALLSPEDYAYGVAGANRFASQCVSRFTGRRVFYNVAEHCVRMSYEAPRGLEYAALMHEGGEPTCNDVTGPLKSLCPDYKAIEKRCERAAFVRFRVEPFDADEMKHLDLRMLATEKRDLMPMAEGDTWSWVKGARPFDWEIVKPWDSYEAAERFLRRYSELAPPEAPRVRAILTGENP